MTNESRIRTIVEQSPVGMLTTFDAHGQPVARPMLALFREAEPDLYFLTPASSEKVSQIAARADVGLTFAAPDSYLSIVGRATVLDDRALVEELWNVTYRAWFPEGPTDPEVSIVRVTIDRADCWEPPRFRVVRLISAVKAMITGSPIETRKTTLKSP